MARRSPLPPPPPPVGIRTWPDRDALLRDRAVVLGELVRTHIGPEPLGVLLVWAGLGAVGWGLVGSALLAFEEGSDPFGVTLGVALAVVGICCLVPSAVFIALGVARDRRVRRLMDAWGGLEPDPEGDLRLRAPRASTVWLVLSFLLCAVGLFVCVSVPATARPGEDTYGKVALWMGLGLIAWLTGLIGLVKAFTHRRWVLRTVRR
ncbi:MULTISPECIES: hypothetical protein [Streptomyces]|uniref:Integral membrane protein n=1 Tax=Streptomyces flavovirens TaxID=52258 RepID=A0ABV8NFF9_9ACTN|nr:hypothetical protein [Streptomyces sp. MBT51]MBK3591748.1 hypothetical protein [Streptomyces sp. MBT51]HBF79333.1 hypothetical protein [Streptomyces sp.]